MVLAYYIRVGKCHHYYKSPRWFKWRLGANASKVVGPLGEQM